MELEIKFERNLTLGENLREKSPFRKRKVRENFFHERSRIDNTIQNKLKLKRVYRGEDGKFYDCGIKIGLVRDRSIHQKGWRIRFDYCIIGDFNPSEIYCTLCNMGYAITHTEITDDTQYKHAEHAEDAGVVGN